MRRWGGDGLSWLAKSVPVKWKVGPHVVQRDPNGDAYDAGVYA